MDELGNMELRINNLFEKISLLEKDNEKTQQAEITFRCDFKTNSDTGLKIHAKKKHTSVEKDLYPRSCHLCDETFDDSKESWG